MSTITDSAPGTPSALTTPPAFAATASPGFMEMGSTVYPQVRSSGLVGDGGCSLCISAACLFLAASVSSAYEPRISTA